jgi:hypothetical protein
MTGKMIPFNNKIKEKADKVEESIENCMNIMAALFGPEAKLTLIVRNTKDPDMEVPFFVTNDNKTELTRIMQLHFGLVVDLAEQTPVDQDSQMTTKQKESGNG